MADWGTPPGLIDNEPRSDSPANDMRIAKLERRRRILEEQEKKKRRHQLGKIERNEVSSARRRDGKTPLVNASSEGHDNHSRYAYDNPEAYNDSNDTPPTSTSVKVVNVAQSPDTLEDTDSESLSDHDNTISSIPAKSQSQSSISSRQQTPPQAQAPSPQPPPTYDHVVQKEKKREKKSKSRKQAQQQEEVTPPKPSPQRIEETRAKAFGSDDEDDLETAVIPDSHVVCIY